MLIIMITIEKTVDISEDGRLHLDLTLPKTVPSGKTNVVLVFPAAETSEFEVRETPPPYIGEHFPTIEELKAEATVRFAEMERTGVDPLAPFAGCLKDVFPEDGLEYQRRMRDEWPD
ncbi:MAG: hypothetical protein LBL31_06325 [Spirochaetaceae bacterium]|jgi:hypothetical protein|nr:hypothetical protein [Spirochaetaceae bacterium]